MSADLPTPQAISALFASAGVESGGLRVRLTIGGVSHWLDVQLAGTSSEGDERRHDLDGIETTSRVSRREGEFGREWRLSVTVCNRRRRMVALEEVAYVLPGLRAASGREPLVDLPGQFSPASPAPLRTLAGRPLDRSADQPTPDFPQGWLKPAPDESTGLVIFREEDGGGTVSVWLMDAEKATTFPTLDGREGGLDLEHRHRLCCRLAPGDSVTSDGYRLLLTEGGAKSAPRAFADAAYAAHRPATRPRWLAQARVLQIDPYPVAKWTPRLARVIEMGFNVLYLTPVWPHLGGWYSVYDHYGVDRRVGTERELRDFVTSAHDRGLRVLFDFIPQGVGVLSPLAQQRPEWLVRDAQGRPFASHGWGPPPHDRLDEVPAEQVGHTLSLDWSRPDVQQYMLDWAAWNVETFGIDGFRTDALHWKEPNLSPDNDAPAWRTMFGGVRLGERLADLLGSERLLFGELPGPAFAASHPVTYEDGWIMNRLNSAWLRGEPVWSAKQWVRWKQLSEASQAPGSIRSPYVASHDMLSTAALAQKSPLADALSFAYAFSGGAAGGMPFSCWAELDWATIDAGGDGRSSFFRQLVIERAKVDNCACSYDVQTAGDDEHLFASRWHYAGGDDHVALANLSMQPLEATVERVGDIALAAGEWQLTPAG